MGATHSLGRMPRQHIVGLVDQGRQCCIPQRDIDSRALPCAFTMQQRRKHGADGVHSGHDIDPSNAHFGRWPVGFAGDGHDATACLQREVKCRLVTAGAVLPISRNAAHNQFGWHRSEQSLKRSRPKIFDDHVRLREKGSNTFCFGLEIGVNHGLVAVARQIVRRHLNPVKPGLKRRPPCSGIVAPGSLHFRDRRTQISE